MSIGLQSVNRIAPGQARRKEYTRVSCKLMSQQERAVLHYLFVDCKISVCLRLLYSNKFTFHDRVLYVCVTKCSAPG